MVRFGDNVKIFRVKNIQIIANKNNNIIIGVDREGEELIAAIEAGKSDSLSLSEKQKILLEELKNNDFFDSTYTEKNELNAVYLHVNSACNLHCLGCYSHVENRNCKDELSLEQWKSIIRDLAREGTKNIVISGGEPFLRKDIVEICHYIKKQGIENLEIISNGTMNVSAYEQVIPYIDALNISIDGYSADTSFIRDKGIMKKVLEVIEHLKILVPLKLIITLHKKNIPFMKEYEKLAKQLGVFMSFSIFTVDFSKEIFEDFKFNENDFMIIGKNIANSENGIVVLDTPFEDVGFMFREGCGFGKQIISIAYNGDVYPCHMLHCAECKMGNATHQKLSDILHRPWFDTKDISLDNIEECCMCEYKYLCGGACRGRAYLFTGDIKKRDPYCLAAKKFFDDAFSNYESI